MIKNTVRIARSGLTLLVAVAACLSVGNLGAQDPDKRKEASGKWAVVQVGSDLRVVQGGAVAGLRKQVQKEWKDTVAEYQEARRRAQKSGKVFNEKKPERVFFKVIKKGLKSEDEAQKARDAYVEGKGSKKGKGGSAWAVVRVNTEFRVIEAAGVKSLVAEIARSDKAARRDWEAAKKAARKNKEPFDQERPTKTAVKPMGRFPSQEAAKAHVAKLEAKRAKKKGTER